VPELAEAAMQAAGRDAGAAAFERADVQDVHDVNAAPLTMTELLFAVLYLPMVNEPEL
jgi:hypothetical protein